MSHQPSGTAGVGTSIIRTGLWSGTGENYFFLNLLASPLSFLLCLLIRLLIFWVNTFFLNYCTRVRNSFHLNCSLQTALTDFHGEVGWSRELGTVSASIARRDAASVSHLHSTATAGTVRPVHPRQPLTIHWRGERDIFEKQMQNVYSETLVS